MEAAWCFRLVTPYIGWFVCSWVLSLIDIPTSLLRILMCSPSGKTKSSISSTSEPIRYASGKLNRSRKSYNGIITQ